MLVGISVCLKLDCVGDVAHLWSGLLEMHHVFSVRGARFTIRIKARKSHNDAIVTGFIKRVTGLALLGEGEVFFGHGGLGNNEEMVVIVET